MNYRNTLKLHAEKQIELLNKLYTKPSIVYSRLVSHANREISNMISSWRRYIEIIPKLSYEKMNEDIKHYKKFRKDINNRNYLNES